MGKHLTLKDIAVSTDLNGNVLVVKTQSGEAFSVQELQALDLTEDELRILILSVRKDIHSASRELGVLADKEAMQAPPINLIKTESSSSMPDQNPIWQEMPTDRAGILNLLINYQGAILADMAATLGGA